MIYLFYRKKNLEVFSLNIPLYIKFTVHWSLNRLGPGSLKVTHLPNVTTYRSLTHKFEVLEEIRSRTFWFVGDRRCCFVVSYALGSSKTIQILTNSNMHIFAKYLTQQPINPYLSTNTSQESRCLCSPMIPWYFLKNRPL